MHALYEIKTMLMEELESNAGKKLTMESLKEIDMLAHALKNTCKVIESCEEEYSERGYSRGYSERGRNRDSRGRYTRDGGSYEGGSYEGGSYEGGSYEGSRDGGMSRAGRSYGGDKNRVVEQLEQLMMSSADDRTRGKFRELIRDMRNG